MLEGACEDNQALAGPLLLPGLEGTRGPPSTFLRRGSAPVPGAGRAAPKCARDDVLPRGCWGKGRPPPPPRGLFLGLSYHFHQTWNFSVKGLRSRAAVGGDGRPPTQTSTDPTSGERADPPPGDDLAYTVALRTDLGTCRVLRGLRICLAIQGTRVQHLSGN